MESRRSFLKNAALLAGATALSNVLPPSIQRALAIEAAPGSTFLDAEHIVFLMQENRSFDHCYGTLKGVRGFNDPRAISLPNGLPVWVQTNAEGKSYVPFRLDIKNTKATWMGSLPHGWGDMVYAHNKGKMDTWLEAKKAGNPDYRHMPLTMGFYDRRDIPFYYALADAFTVCDQHFCSSLTGTSANRSYFWSGTIRENAHDPESVAHVDNGQIVYKNVGWKTYPERLQEAGIPWKVYQNELSLPVGFEGQEEDWLANFTDNNLEFHKQYQVRFHPAHYAFMERKVQQLEQELASEIANSDAVKEKKKQLESLKADLKTYSPKNFERLPSFEKEIHKRALATNEADPDYHQLTTIRYQDEEGGKSVQVPKGDVFYQFRKDVEEGNLPMVSWLVAPCNFSDHPGAPWYGAWYVSEALDILTKNPEVWKKTIFLLTYDENDGYFDHMPPFSPPHSGRPEEGAVPKGMDTAEEYVTADQEKVRSGDPQAALDNSIGLGFRVPLVIASPWTKGGRVCSEVFDHTSSLQFLEYFIAHKTGKEVRESNISDWRRLICGNLTSAFHTAGSEKEDHLQMLKRDEHVEQIYSAKDKALPGNFRLLNEADLTSIRQGLRAPDVLPKQEKGVKTACPIPYDLQIMARLDKTSGQLSLQFNVLGNLPKTKTIGVPFRVYAAVPYGKDERPGRAWNFAAREGETTAYVWPLADFGQQYHLKAYGPNGFFQEFKGDRSDPDLSIRVSMEQDKNTGGRMLTFHFFSNQKQDLQIKLSDQAYKRADQNILLDKEKAEAHAILDLSNSNGWYDYTVQVNGFPAYMQRFAGHVENGKESTSDPYMGGIV